jgi:hypothetical protein
MYNATESLDLKLPFHSEGTYSVTTPSGSIRPRLIETPLAFIMSSIVLCWPPSVESLNQPRLSAMRCLSQKSKRLVPSQHYRRVP